jgi:hypothetical protein
VLELDLVWGIAFAGCGLGRVGGPLQAGAAPTFGIISAGLICSSSSPR